MPLPNSHNPYNFDTFLNWRQSFDYYCDDPFIQKVVKHFAGEQWDMVDQEARKISPKISFRWRDMAEAIARPEKRPFIIPFDGHHHRIDRIIRPTEAEIMEKEIFSEGLFSSNTSPWIRLVKMYLIYQNGEACISCPLTCTEGLVALLEKHADSPETKSILQHCKEGIGGDFAVGAQYLSEIQGGSDVAANLLEAVPNGKIWRVYGTKFFCSATHADYAVVTAKPVGSEEIGVFVVPSWLPGNKDKEIRNGYTIDRLKWKLGTSELTTAEITFDGAIAYPVGPLDKGIANVVGIVLTCSRLTVGLSAAAGMTRAVREAQKYSEVRKAFGFTIDRFPLLARQITSIQKYAKRTTAGAFKLYSEFLKLEGGLIGGLVTDEPEQMKKRRFNVRELIMLQKITASWDSVDVLRTAISVFGGHGVIEDFSSLPRLFRDAVINELWEGPRNVLLTQIYQDFQRVVDWYKPSDFVQDILSGSSDTVIKELSEEMSELVSHATLVHMDEKTMEVCERWDRFCQKLFQTYQDLSITEIG